MITLVCLLTGHRFVRSGSTIYCADCGKGLK